MSEAELIYIKSTSYISLIYTTTLSNQFFIHFQNFRSEKKNCQNLARLGQSLTKKHKKKKTIEKKEQENLKMSFQYGGGYEPSAPPMQNYPSEVNSMLLQENFALKQEIDRLKAELATRVQTTTQIPVPQSPEKGVINAISGWQKLTFSRQYTQNPIGLSCFFSLCLIKMTKFKNYQKIQLCCNVKHQICQLHLLLMSPNKTAMCACSRFEISFIVLNSKIFDQKTKKKKQTRLGKNILGQRLFSSFFFPKNTH